MSRTFAPLLALLLTLLALCGCTGAWRQISAEPEDYASYREFRTAQELPARFRASGEYLKQHPEGRWNLELREWLTQTGGSYMQRWWHDEARLLDYLTWVPQGPHSSAIELRLQALAAHSVAQREQERRLLASARQQETAMTRAAALRQELLAGYKLWLSHLASLRPLGRPTAELPHAFLHDFREIEPRAQCAGDRCTKPVLLPYGVSAERQLSWRELLFDVELSLDGGVVVAASISGVGLVASVAEALQKRAVDRGDLQAQAEALGATMQFSAMTLESFLPVAECERPAVSPLVLVRECGGTRLEFRVAEALDEPDRITIQQSAGAAPAAP